MGIYVNSEYIYVSTALDNMWLCCIHSTRPKIFKLFFMFPQTTWKYSDEMMFYRKLLITQKLLNIDIIRSAACFVGIRITKFTLFI